MTTERLLYDILQSELTALAAEPQRYAEWLRKRLRATEAAKARAYFTENPPRLFMEFPFAEAHFPSWWIVLGEGRESTQFVGGYTGDADASDAAAIGLGGARIGSPKTGAMWTTTYHVISATGNPDATIWLHEIAKSVLYYRNADLSAELPRMQMAEAQLNPKALELPATIATRRLSVETTRKLEVVGPALPTIRDVVGIANVDATVPDADRGFIPTQVTPET